MTEAAKEGIPTLTSELQEKLKFETDPEREWLINDQFVYVGGVDLYEWLPARTRVSSDGTRVEIGARTEDIEGLLALARILKPDATGIDKLTSFWENHPTFSTKNEDGWVFIGINIQPTTEDFEREYGPLNSAWHLALAATVENITMDEVKNHKEHKRSLKHAENPNTHGRTVLFDSGFMDRILEASTQCKSSDDSETEDIIVANTLRDFPLDTYKTSINFAPGTLIRSGEKKELDDVSVQAYNGEPEVFICDLDSRYDWEKEEWIRDSLRLILPIPGDLQLATVNDLEQLSFAVLKNDNFEVEREMNVSITVEDDSFKIESEDGSFFLEVRKPVCDECNTPVWKFPYPQAAHIGRSGTGDFYETNSSLGILRFLVKSEDSKKTYCGDCIEVITDRYIVEHPFVDKARAVNIVRRRLDESGYEDVQIWEDQVFHWEPGFWHFLTKIEYERNGRKIIRFTGTPTLTDDGHFEPKMQPAEFVNFRYPEKTPSDLQ